MANNCRYTRRAWTIVLVGLQALFVVGPLAVVLVWALAERWAWPQIVPQALSVRGVSLVLGDTGGAATLLTSVAIATCSALIATLCASLVARALTWYTWRGQGLVRFALLIPFLVPSTLFAMGVQVVFIRAGLAGSWWGVALAHAIVGLPYSCAILIDASAAAGRRLEDAARTLGASSFKATLHVSIPQLAPALTSSFVMAYIVSFSQYFLTLLIGAGRVKTFALALFPYLAQGDRTIAAAYSAVFIGSILVVFFMFDVLLRRAWANKFYVPEG